MNKKEYIKQFLKKNKSTTIKILFNDIFDGYRREVEPTDTLTLEECLPMISNEKQQRMINWIKNQQHNNKDIV